MGGLAEKNSDFHALTKSISTYPKDIILQSTKHPIFIFLKEIMNAICILQFLFEMCWIKKDHVFQVAEKSQGSLVMRRAGSALGGVLVKR